MEDLKKIEKTQGVELSKKTKISKTYTLTQLAEMTRKLKELDWITEEEEQQLIKIRENAKKQFIKSL